MVFRSIGSPHYLQQQQQQQQAVPRSRGTIRRRPGALLAAVGSLALAVACVSHQLSTLRLPASGSAFVGLPSAASAAEARKVQRHAIEDDTEQAVVAADEGTEADAPEAAPAPATPAEEAEVAPLFQEIYVSNRSSHKIISSALIAIFNKGERAADLILMDTRMKHIPMYAIAIVPDNFRAAGMVLPRKRDRRMRIRVVQHAQPPPDEDGGLPSVLRLGSTVNASKIANLMKYQFVDSRGNNLKRQVKLEFAGPAAAGNAMLAVEGAMQRTNREIVFVPRWEEFIVNDGLKEVPAAEGAEDAEAVPVPKTQSKVIQCGVIVTAT